MWQRVKLPAICLALLAGLAWLAIRTAQSRAWLEFRGERFWQALARVHPLYLVLGVGFIYGSYFFRSLRWRQFLAPIKIASLGNIFTSTVIGFSAVALLGRPGELVRPLLIARKERVALSSQLAAWTLERVFDALTVGILMGAALALSPPQSNPGAMGAGIIAHLKTAGMVVCAGAVLFAAVLSQARRNASILTKGFLWSARAIPERYRGSFEKRLRSLLASFTDGLASIETVDRFAVCAGLSMLVWIPVVLAYWSVMQAFGQPLSNLNPGAIVLLMAVSVVGSLAQLPGIGGGPQVASALVLTQLFGIPLEIASTAAILLWAISFMSVLVVGLPLAAREGLNWQRLRSIMKTADIRAAEQPVALEMDSQ